MNNLLVTEIVNKLRAIGIPPDFGSDRSRVLIRTYRALAKGHPITREQVNTIANDLGISQHEAHEFLKQVTERDADDNVVGVMGLSLNEGWPHRFHVNGSSLRTWCAWDALFIPPLLKETVTVESLAPGTDTRVRLTVSPERVEQSKPANATVSIVVPDPKKHDVSSLEGIWSSFCHQIYFFGSREEADRWAAGKEDIEILTVEEAYELGKQVFSELNSYA
ncbi:MAG: organomercurial lyase [Dehalococcoidia bacterium]